MNRNSSASGIPFLTFMVVTVGFLAITLGGVHYADCKNRQTKLIRKIDAVERRSEKCRLDIAITEMRKEEQVRYFVIAKKLKDHQSTLCQIPREAIEEVGTTLLPRQTVASAVP